MSLESKLSALASAVGTDVKDLRTTRGTLSSLTTTNKTSIVNAINELVSTIAAGGINDATTTTTSTWSSTKINTSINTAVSTLVASAPAALDTLNELAAALGNDANFATTTATALGNRVRVDAAQAFTAPQKVQGLANLGAAAEVHSHVITDVTGLQAALDLKAPLASPALTGTPTAPTATAGTNTTQLATTAFVTSGLALKTDASSFTALTTGLGNYDADITAAYIAARDAV